VTADETSLGATIHAWRDRLTPAEVGLAAGRARRTAGLRREELSELAGISVDCDVLNDSDTDLKIVIYTTVPGSEDESKLDLARVAGTRPVR
jgi:hypothetical protein